MGRQNKLEEEARLEKMREKLGSAREPSAKRNRKVGHTESKAKSPEAKHR